MVGAALALTLALGGQVDWSVDAARVYWQIPQRTQIHVVAKPFGQHRSGWDAYTRANADGTYTVAFNTAHRLTATERCSDAWHEVGHVHQHLLTGDMWHSDNPGSLMYGWRTVIPRKCRLRFS